MTCCIGEINMASDFENTRLVTFVTSHVNSSVCESMCLSLNMDFLELTDLQKFFRILPNTSFHTDAIVIDIDKLNGYSNVTLLDLIMSLRTLTHCKSGILGVPLHIPIGISVTLAAAEQDITLIKDVLRTGYVVGLYPAGSEFTVEEKTLALGNILNNQLHIPEKINKLLYEKKKTPKKTVINEIKLTPRQHQIQNLIIDKGASNKLIARMLNISESTVKLHMTQILKKHGLTNRTQLALFAKPKLVESKT
jgi:DNA-binding NarL/FixJ family response regulator